MDVVGIGNPLMDIIVEITDDQLIELDFKKGTMNLVNHDDIERIEGMLTSNKMTLVPGGSVANTLSTFALLGGSAVFMGKAGKDEHGDIYEQKLEGGKVLSKISKDVGKTGKVISLVTPDSERTFATYLGMCLQLKKEDIVEDDIKNAKILHLTGYQLEDKGLREASLYAMGIAKENNTKISIDLADPALVERNSADMKELIRYADILFANEEEMKVLSDDPMNDFGWIETLIVKLGKKGSMARHKGKIYQVEARPVKAIDTTGAGDSYAAAILYGLTHDIEFQHAMELASHVSARVVETIGARIDDIGENQWIKERTTK